MHSLRWSFTLGVVGFLSGFIGPMLLAPHANQGPLVGILITGPGGFLTGLVVGVILQLKGVAEAASRNALLVVASLFAVVTLYTCIPAKRHVADLLEGEMLTCADPRTLKDAAVARQDEIDAHHNYVPKKPWDTEFDRMLHETPGVVIEFRLHRTRAIYEGRANGSYGALSADPWRSTHAIVSYYAARFDCSAVTKGGVVTLASNGSGLAWPPYDIGQLLQLATAARVPVDYARFGN